MEIFLLNNATFHLGSHDNDWTSLEQWNYKLFVSQGKQQDKVLKKIAAELLQNASSATKHEVVPDSIEHEKKIYVCNMWPNTTTAEMETHFGEFGKVVDAAILNQFEKSSNGIVKYSEKQMVEAALAVTHEMSGRRVFVKKSEPKYRSKADGKSTSKGARYYPY